MKTPLHVLLVEDSEDDALLILRELTRHGYAVQHQRVQTAAALRTALAQPGWEVVLSDYALPGFSGEEALRIVRENHRDIPFIFISGTMGEDVAVAAMKAGANDYVMKGNLARLGVAVTRELTEITARLLAEEARRTSEQRLSTVFHLSPTAICILRLADERFVDANEAFCHGTGYTRDELLGRTPTELNLWSDPAEREAILQQMQTKGTAIACKLHGRRKTGEIGVGLGSVTRIPLNGEEHLLWLILDVTELERAEQARHESESRFQQVADNIDEVFWLADGNRSQFFYVSPAYERISGRTCASLYANARAWLESVAPADRTQFATATQSLRDHGTYNLEYRILRPDGTVRWIHDRAFPIKDAEGNVCRVAGVAEDITVKRQLEDQLRQAQKIESLGTLAGGIAHDFNNILTGVLGSAEIVRMEMPADHPASPWIHNIIAAGMRARELVQQILTFGRKHDSEMVPVKLSCVVGEALQLLRSSIPSMVQIESQIDDRCPPVVADSTQIHQVVMNLCTNAWHALPAHGGRIEVTLAATTVSPETASIRLGLKASDYTLLTVRDNGRGMSPEVLTHIFEPFFTTKKKGQGTGLGLSVVHGIVQSHGGAIFVQSTPGQGTVFEIFLPAWIAPAGSTLSGHDKSLARGNGEHVMLVDDDDMALVALRGQLQHLGYEVSAFSDPRLAIERFLAAPEEFRLLLTDYAMPDFSGHDLAAKVLAACPRFPVVLVSGFIDSRQIQRARALGVREFIRKPVDIVELARTVGRHVQQTPSETNGKPAKA